MPAEAEGFGRLATVVCAVFGVTVAMAQDAENAAAAQDVVGESAPEELAEIRGVLAEDTGSGELADDAGDAAAEADSEAGADEELTEIVLPRQTMFEDEPYLDEEDERILDTGPMPETDAQRLRRLFVLYMDAVADRTFTEADSLAKQIVELTIEIHGLDSHESAKALTNLAIAQHGIEDFESAILNYDAAIGIIERVEDRLNSALINPLRGLGAAQLASGRPDLARDTFDRAVHISHVNEGPHNLDQIETLHSLAETYLAVGEFDDAVDIQKRIYYLQARNVDARSVDIIPALRTRARWQHRMQLYEQERYTLRRIISVIEDNKGKESLDLIAPLTELGNSFLFISYSDAPYSQPVSVTSGEIYLKRAVRIAEANPEADWRILTDAMLELGDYYLLSERPNRGHRVYRDVWRLLSEDEARAASRAEQLEQVVLLQDIDPPTMYGGDPAVPVSADLPGYLTGTAVYRYSVSTRGRSTNVRLVESDPPGLDDMYQSVGRQIRRIMHRPRLEDGAPVQTDDLTFNHTFYYREADLPNAPVPASTEADTAAPD